MLKLTITLCIALAACSCATEPPQPSAGQLWQQESEGISAKFRWQMDTARALDPIRGKVALFSPRDIRFEMLANTGKPTVEERNAILELARIRDEYWQEQKALDQRYNNPFARVPEAQYAAVSAVWADLYNGAITFGESARKRQEIDATTNEARQRLRSSLSSEAAAAEQLSIQRLNNYLLLQQTLRQNQPVQLRTTCTAIGNTLYCQ